ncbi:MAG: 30S ribosomal protein S6e [Candidatus Woesearchaeota archaeon]
MAEFKLVLSTKDGKSHQREVKDKDARPFLGKKVRDIINGDDFGLIGYEVQITGGSDYCGFPMRPEIPGTARKKVLAVSGVGVRKKAKGTRQRKTVCGNTIHGKIVQINLKVIKEGKEKLGEPEEKTPEKSKEPADKESADKKTEQDTKAAKPATKADAETVEESAKATPKKTEKPATKHAEATAEKKSEPKSDAAHEKKPEEKPSKKQALTEKPDTKSVDGAEPAAKSAKKKE